jgi:hypothetical protein
VGVIVGFNNQARVFSVYEREDPTLGTIQRARALAAVRGGKPAKRGRKR